MRTTRRGLLRSLTSSDVSCPREKMGNNGVVHRRRLATRGEERTKGFSRRIARCASNKEAGTAVRRSRSLGGEAYDAVARTYRGSNCVVRISIRGSGRETGAREEDGIV